MASRTRRVARAAGPATTTGRPPRASRRNGMHRGPASRTGARSDAGGRLPSEGAPRFDPSSSVRLRGWRSRRRVQRGSRSRGCRRRSTAAATRSSERLATRSRSPPGSFATATRRSARRFATRVRAPPAGPRCRSSRSATTSGTARSRSTDRDPGASGSRPGSIPIHPIGRTNRKGRNNSETAEPGDVGSPWAIGAKEGGHDAIDPSLGTEKELRALVADAKKLGIEIALDFAIQCSPDHPWLKEHPEWFHRRPDGTLKYAENPPKRYQDIYNVDFGSEDWRGLWQALLDVVLHWVGCGITVFRVDNPHTKPLPFWEWLIREVRRERPEVIFLSEAFTRPAPMTTLAKAGFAQSYTYFTWKNTRCELLEFLGQLLEWREFYRPNCFANTPDILHEYLQAGSRPAFEARLVLAATLSPAYGIYSGFGHCAG